MVFSTSCGCCVDVDARCLAAERPTCRFHVTKALVWDEEWNELPKSLEIACISPSCVCCLLRNQKIDFAIVYDCHRVVDEGKKLFGDCEHKKAAEIGFEIARIGDSVGGIVESWERFLMKSRVLGTGWFWWARWEETAIIQLNFHLLILVTSEMRKADSDPEDSGRLWVRDKTLISVPRGI
jgi:hypothetical protein